jgi:DNA-binding MarR family transcriptional regulator
LSKGERAVIYSLLHRANENYIAFPSLRELMLDTGYEIHSILRSIRSLSEKKLIIVEKRNGMKNRYNVSSWMPDRT